VGGEINEEQMAQCKNNVSHMDKWYSAMQEVFVE
jgi:hypothetical protein